MKPIFAALAWMLLVSTMLLAQSNPVPLINKPLVSTRTASGLSQSDSLAQGKMVQSYGKLPLSFEANNGQTKADVKFLSRGAGYTLFLTSDAAVFSLRGRKANGATYVPGRKLAIEYGNADNSAVLRMKLDHASLTARVTGVEELPGKSNYFLGNDPRKWRTNVVNYAKVRYENVYPGVDLVYYGNQGRLEYDFMVAPGANPQAIGLDFAGARRIRVDRATGDLLLNVGEEDVRLHKPVMYQPVSKDHGQLTGDKTFIDGHYRVSGHRVVFEIPSYDPQRLLVIDPSLSYSSYLGGGYWEQGPSIAVGQRGEAYLTGFTQSVDFPVTHDAFQPVNAGSGDVFITKFNVAGSALVYSTFVGGSSSDRGLSIKTDSLGDAYVTGYTASTNFPTTPGAFQTTCGCNALDAFVIELNPTGSGLVYSTYLGGSSTEFGYGIAVGASGNAYITGSTVSTDFPVTAGAFQTVCLDCQQFAGSSFVTELNPSGSALVYSTFLGGTGREQGSGIAVDATGSAYLTGFTYSGDFPVTPGAFQTTCACNPSLGLGDAFASKLNPTGSALVYSTFLGGTVGNPYSYAYGTGIALNSSGNAYVTGYTASSDFPTTPGAFQTKNLGILNAFVTEMNPAGSALVYSTYLGGSNYTTGQGIALDHSGNAYVAGDAVSTSFPTTPGAFQTSCADSNGGCSLGDVFVTELNPVGSGLVYSTYIGGINSDNGTGIALDAVGDFYVTGDTQSSNFPTTLGAFQTTCSGGNCVFPDTDLFLAKFIPGDGFQPVGLDFGDEPVGMTSLPQTATFTNSGQATLNITSIGLTGEDIGDFFQSNTCGSSLAVGASCAFTVTFTPSANGARAAAVSITDDAPNRPQRLFLLGVGGEPAVTLSTASLKFPPQLTYTSSRPRTVKLTNTGPGTLYITSIVTTINFSQTNTCGASVVGGASCTISVVFSPTKRIHYAGSLTITDNAPGSPQTVSLTGSGTIVKLEPASLNFGNVQVGQTSSAETVTLTNTGFQTLSITGISITGTDPGDFSETNTCGSSLAGGASCTINVTFTPAVKGNRSAYLLFKDNGGGSQKISLIGTGT